MLLNIENNYLTSNSIEDRENLTKTLDIVNNMNGDSVVVNGGANLGINIGNFGIGIKSQGTVVGSMVVDQNRNKYVDNIEHVFSKIEDAISNAKKINIG